MRFRPVITLSVFSLAIGTTGLSANPHHGSADGPPPAAVPCPPECGPVCQPRPCVLKTLLDHCKGSHGPKCVSHPHQHHAPAPKVTVVVPPPEVVFRPAAPPAAAPAPHVVAAPRAVAPQVQYQPVVRQVVTMQPVMTMQPVVQHVVTMQAVPAGNFVAAPAVAPNVAPAPAALGIQCDGKDVCAEIARLDADIERMTKIVARELEALKVLRDANGFEDAQKKLRELLPNK